jgi:hypothetical protein
MGYAVTAFHLPARPAWTCVVCGDDYPCATRRAQLLADFDGAAVQLAVFMSLEYLQAATDLSTVAAQVLHARFFWYRYRQPEANEIRKDGTG